jgi:hypothetical protein
MSACRHLFTASVAGDLPRVSRAIWTAPREAERTRRACGIRTALSFQLFHGRIVSDHGVHDLPFSRHELERWNQSEPDALGGMVTPPLRQGARKRS